MAASGDLKIFLESSLNEIFKATVSDILDSVERTLSEYRGTIHRIESENEGLKRLLFAQKSCESTASDIGEQDASEKLSTLEWNNRPINCSQGTFMMSICSSDKKSFRRKQKDKMRESISSSSFLLPTDHVVERPCVNTAEVGASTQNSISVKAEPDLDERDAVELSQPSSLLNLTARPLKNERREVNFDSYDAYAPLSPSTGLEEKSDREVKVAIVSDSYVHDGQVIKTEEEEQNGVLQYEDSKTELKHALRYFPESETHAEAVSRPVVEPEVMALEENAAVPVDKFLEIRDNFLRCPTCPKTFSRAALLNIHIKTHCGEKAHGCSYCGKHFGRADLLKSHKCTHTGERPYSCNLCSKTYAHPSQLRIHKRVHTGEKPYSCSHCGKRFKEHNQLKVHLRTHTGERPYSCQECGKTFNNAGNLRIHERIHTGEKPYCCAQCGKRFNGLGDLKTHYRIHTGERPYICELCKKSFSRSGHLKRHKLVHTKEKVFLCSQCGKTYTDQSSLKKHLKMHVTKAQSEGSTGEAETSQPSASETLSDTERS